MCGRKNTLKCVKYYLKTKNSCLKIQTKLALNIFSFKKKKKPFPFLRSLNNEY